MKFYSDRRRVFLLAVFWIGVMLLAACRPAAAPAPTPAVKIEVDLAQVMKGVENAAGGWKPAEEARFFTKDTLFDLMDGQSDAFFVYGFEKAAVQRFNHSSGVTLMVSIYQVNAADSAYGLFSVNGDQQPLQLGSEGNTTPGRRVSFWQDRFFVQATALKPVPQADLQAVGEAIAAALPKGGETPALMKALPEQNKVAKPGPLYFHQELSIQDRVWLGGENKLGLGEDTNGTLGRYTLNGEPAELMIIEYPDASRAAKGLQALQDGSLEDLLAAKAQGKRLAAVFGKADKADAEGLINSALK